MAKIKYRLSEKNSWEDARLSQEARTWEAENRDSTKAFVSVCVPASLAPDMLYQNTKWLETVSNVTVMREVFNPLAFSSKFTFHGSGLLAQTWRRVTSCLVAQIRSQL